MNPLTQIKNTQKATQREIVEGISDKASWHARFKHSAYIFSGGLPFELTEGDLLAVFSQYGEIVDVNLCRDRKTGKSRGFAFLAYMDQRSTVLAVDNLSGARVGGRIIRVEHVDNYKKKKAEMTGEPESEEDEEGGRAIAGPAGVQAARWDHQGYEQQAGAPARGREAANGGAVAAPGAGGAGGGDEPWANPNSVFALLAAGPQPSGGWAPLPGSRGAPAVEEGGRSMDRKVKKEKRQKKEKKEKKEKRDRKRRLGSPDTEGLDSEGGGSREARKHIGPPQPPSAAAAAAAAAGGRRGEQGGSHFGPPRQLGSQRGEEQWGREPSWDRGGGGGSRERSPDGRGRQGGGRGGPPPARARSRSREGGGEQQRRRRQRSRSPWGRGWARAAAGQLQPLARAQAQEEQIALR